MNQSNISSQELLDLANEMLTVRDDIKNNTLNSVFTEMSLVSYVFLKKAWPELLHANICPTREIYLKDIQEDTGYHMSSISKSVENLVKYNFVLWQQSDETSFIQLTEYGWMQYKKQQSIVIEYFERIVNKIGLSEFREALDKLQALESVIKSESPRYPKIASLTYQY